MHDIFNEDKYKEAANKAYDFIKRMLDPSAWEVEPYYGEHYDENYAHQLMWGGVRNIPDDAVRIDPNYIQPSQYYPPGYVGVMRGTYKLPEGEDPKNYAVVIYRVSGSARSIECFCPLFTETADDGTVSYTWSTGRLVEAWEYYLQAYDRESPYMTDGAGGYIPWESSESGGSPTKYYKTDFTTSTGDSRYGLLTGGYGVYDENYNYSETEIEWCSIEHQCSALQALEGCSLVLKDAKYKEAAELVRDQLYIKCYDKENKRFYQGINRGQPDEAWALDCTTWAGIMILSVVHSDCSKNCMATARDVYLTEDKEILQSSESAHYNMTYSSERTFAGFKPYSDRTADYAGAPDLVWTEGTLGYAMLSLVLGNTAEAKLYVDECIELQNCEGSTGGVIYTTATYAALPWEFHTWESLVSSAWLYLIIHAPEVLFPRTLRQVYYMAKIMDIDDERTSRH